MIGQGTKHQKHFSHPDTKHHRPPPRTQVLLPGCRGLGETPHWLRSRLEPMQPWELKAEKKRSCRKTMLFIRHLCWRPETCPLGA